MSPKKILSFVSTFILLTFYCYSNSWTPAVDISYLPAEFANENRPPEIGVDEKANAFAAWSSRENKQNVIKAARFDAAIQTWSDPVQIGNDNAESPVLAVTKDGKAIVLWRNSNDALIHYNFYDGNWHSDQLVDGAGDPDQAHPSVGVDALGHAIAVWQIGGGFDADEIYSAVFDFTAMSWGTSVYISGTPTVEKVGQPIIAVNDKGDAVAVWRRYEYVYFSGPSLLEAHIEAQKYTFGSGWGGTNEIVYVTNSDRTNPANELILPIVAIDSNSNAIALFLEIDNSRQAAFFAPGGSTSFLASYRTGSGWQPTPDILSSGVETIADPEKGPYPMDVAFDLSGDAVAVWFEANGFIPPPPPPPPSQANGTPSLNGGVTALSTPIATVQASIFHFSATPWSPKKLISDLGIFSGWPQVAVDGIGDAWAIWTTFRNAGSQATINATKFTKTLQSWQSPSEQLSTRELNSLSNIATNTAGCFFADWPSGDNSGANPSSNIVQASRIPCQSTPPQNIKGCKKSNAFLSQTEYFNVIQWSPPSSSSVIGYKIIRNHQQIAFVTCTTFVDHNQPKCCSTFYEVIAVYASGNESKPIGITIK